jgi:hypothetical protein
VLERKKTLNVFKESKSAWGSYDDYPVGPKGTDPMPHLSRNRVAQPFFLVAEEDQVLIHMAGEGTLELRETEPQQMTLVPGDSVYIPAGIPTRVVPRGEVTQLRLKAEPAGKEAVAWYCPKCNALVHTLELEPGIVQERYWQAVLTFNADEKLRACPSCKAVHPVVDLGDIAWRDVAAAIRADD